MKLYGHARSASTRKALLTLAEKGAQAQLIEIDLAVGEHKHAAHLARHPLGGIPVLEHQGLTLYPWSAIVRYLDDVLPGPPLTPQDVLGRARMEQWLALESAHLAGPCRTLQRELVGARAYGLAPDDTRVEQARRELQLPLSMLDASLRGAAYLAGAQFSLADVALLPCLQLLSDLGQGGLLMAQPALWSYWQRMQTRASWQRVVGLRGEPGTAPCMAWRSAAQSPSATH